MRMADARDVLGRGAELDRHDRLGDQLARQAADRVHAEDAVGPRVGEDLDEALGLFAAERATVVGEREAPGPVGDARSEEHTSELQSRLHLVCRLLLEKKKTL